MGYGLFVFHIAFKMNKKKLKAISKLIQRYATVWTAFHILHTHIHIRRRLSSFIHNSETLFRSAISKICMCSTWICLYQANALYCSFFIMMLEGGDCDSTLFGMFKIKFFELNTLSMALPYSILVFILNEIVYGDRACLAWYWITAAWICHTFHLSFSFNLSLCAGRNTRNIVRALFEFTFVGFWAKHPLPSLVIFWLELSIPSISEYC